MCILTLDINQLNISIMLHRFTKTQFYSVINSHFDVLVFYPNSIYFKGQKLSRLALVDFCRLLWKFLETNSSVVNGTWRLSPCPSWRSLGAADLNCFARVLLTDCLQMNCFYSSHVLDAYFEILPLSPFASFVSKVKISKDVKIKTRTIYEFEGIEYSSVSDVSDAVSKRFPPSQYNINLIF